MLSFLPSRTLATKPCLFLGGMALGAVLLAQCLMPIALANADQVCLIAPNGGEIFLRRPDGARTGQKWANKSLASVLKPLSEDNSDDDSGERFQGQLVQVSLTTGEQGWVSSVVIQQDLTPCDSETSPLPSLPTSEEPSGAQPPSAEPPAPQPAEAPNGTPINGNPDGNIPAEASDPFRCGTGARANACNRQALHEFANKGRHTLGYDRARLVMFQDVDSYTTENGARVVDSVYSNDIYRVGNGIPSDSEGVNTEHTWPQSKLKQYSNFNQTKADIYHLYPVEKRINSTRGNLPFVEINGEPSGQGKQPEVNSQGFEPPEDHKGHVARAMFYMSITYNMPIDDAQERVLRRWNEQYPVDAKERARGDCIESAQGNRNPFIDQPDWIQLVSDF